MDLLKSELKIYESGDKKERERLSGFQSDLKKNLELCEKEEGWVFLFILHLLFIWDIIVLPEMFLLIDVLTAKYLFGDYLNVTNYKVIIVYVYKA